MTTVLSAVMPRPDAPIELRELPEPQLEPDSALLAVSLSEVCGTDMHLHHGRLQGVPYPLIPGHVTVGCLEKIRGRLLDVHGQPFCEGDAVTFLDVHATCHACWYCLVAKASTRCPKRKVYGITYGVDDGLCGGWAQKLYLKPQTRCLSLANVDLEQFMAGGCGLPTAMHAVQRADIQLGETVLVLGCGPVGLCAVILAAMRGAGRVLCIGAPEERLQTARAVGAADTLNFQVRDMPARLEWIGSHTSGRGADVTIEATGAPVAVTEALHYTRDAGRVVVVGQYTDCGNTEFNPHEDLNKKHLDVRGCWGSDFSHFYLATQILADPQRAAPFSQIKLERFGLSQANEALAAVADHRVVKALIDPNLT